MENDMQALNNLRREAYDFLEGKGGAGGLFATFLSAGYHGWESSFLYSGYKPIQLS